MGTTDNTNSTLAGTIKIDKMPSEQGHRLYVKGRHLSYQRGKRNTNPNTSLIKIEGVDDSKAASFYLGKKVAFVYRASKEVRGTKIRVMWGKVTRAHGTYPMDSRKSQGRHLTQNSQATLVSSALSSATTS